MTQHFTLFSVLLLRKITIYKNTKQPQYKKLNAADNLPEQNPDRLNTRIQVILFDRKEYMPDRTTILFKSMERGSIKKEVVELYNVGKLSDVPS